MSMSEFERQSMNAGDEFSALHGKAIPPDFSEEDLAFARELHTLFPLEGEELPPYFVETLLNAENPRLQPAEHGFEHKIRATVFRRLKLRRRLFASHRPPLATLIGTVTARRAMIPLIAVYLLLTIFTVAFTNQSFIEGVSLLLHDTHAGVYQVQKYPDGVQSPNYGSYEIQPAKISLFETQQLLHFPMYWPQVTPPQYSLDGINLYSQPQAWADGPILELHFDYNTPGTKTLGTGEIAICEFKPSADVYQLVETNAAHYIQLNNGTDQAIYVDGQWVSHNYSRSWVYGDRSELIYEINGVVFWIVGDQRDGIDQNVLLQIAQSMQVLDMTRLQHMGSDVQQNDVAQSVYSSSDLFAGDTIVVYPDNNSLATPYLTLVGPDQPPQTNHIQKHGLH